MDDLDLFYATVNLGGICMGRTDTIVCWDRSRVIALRTIGHLVFKVSNLVKSVKMSVSDMTSHLLNQWMDFD